MAHTYMAPGAGPWFTDDDNSYTDGTPAGRVPEWGMTVDGLTSARGSFTGSDEGGLVGGAGISLVGGGSR